MALCCVYFAILEYTGLFMHLLSYKTYTFGNVCFNNRICLTSTCVSQLSKVRQSFKWMAMLPCCPAH